MSKESVSTAIVAIFGMLVMITIVNETAAEEDKIKPPLLGHHYFSKTEHSHAATWSYTGKTGPEFWGQLDPAYRLAATGRQQSPIDIQTRKTISKTLPQLKFDYQSEQVSSFNNGHTIQHDDEPGSFLYVGDQRYALEQFHVHTPSEHTIDGKQFPMEIHFVHRATSKEVAVVAVLVEADAEGEVEVPYYYDLSTQPGEHVRYEGQQNPSDLLPRRRDYYEYLGSFTTPPCTEGIRWFVLKQTVKASPERIRRFEIVLKANNRPVQLLHGRTISISK